MSRPAHRPCPYRTTRKRRGQPTHDYCTAAHGSHDSWPLCNYCRDHRGGRARKPCKFRRKEVRGGVLGDWCHAIGAFEVGDMPCDDCQTDEKTRRQT